MNVHAHTRGREEESEKSSVKYRKEPSSRQCEKNMLHPIQRVVHLMFETRQKIIINIQIKNKRYKIKTRRWELTARTNRAIENVVHVAVASVLDNVLFTYSIDIEYHDCYSEHGLFDTRIYN